MTRFSSSVVPRRDCIGAIPRERSAHRRGHQAEDRTRGADREGVGDSSSAPNEPPSSDTKNTIAKRSRPSVGSRSGPRKYRKYMLKPMCRSPACSKPAVRIRQTRRRRRGAEQGALGETDLEARLRLPRVTAAPRRTRVTLMAMSTSVDRGDPAGRDGAHLRLLCGALRAAHADRRGGHAVRADRAPAARARDAGLPVGVAVAVIVVVSLACTATELTLAAAAARPAPRAGGPGSGSADGLDDRRARRDLAAARQRLVGHEDRACRAEACRPRPRRGRRARRTARAGFGPWRSFGSSSHSS